MSAYYTIDGFEQLTRQQMFDMSARHILSTRTQSLDSAGNCVYAGSGCNAAPFLKPEERANADAATGGEVACWGNLEAAGYVPSHEMLFINNLQEVHDEAGTDGDFMTQYVRSMRAFAFDHGLNADVLNGEPA